MGFQFMPWPLTFSGQRCVSFNISKNYEGWKVHLYYRHIRNGIWAFVLCHELWPWSKVKDTFFFNISKTMRDTMFISITDIWEPVYGLLFYAMTIDLGQRSKVKGVVSFNISNTMRDRRFICIEDIQKTIVWALILCHDLWPLS